MLWIKLPIAYELRKSGLVTAHADGTGRLADPTDLPVTDDLLTEDGTPDRAKVLAATDELLTRKPHLSSTRVAGDVGQGARGAPRLSCR